VFNITTDASSTQTTQQVIKGSDLLSEANLTLISAEDTEVIGSLLQAAGDIGITAAGGPSHQGSNGGCHHALHQQHNPRLCRRRCRC
jgi:hypothetical protein